MVHAVNLIGAEGLCGTPVAAGAAFKERQRQRSAAIHNGGVDGKCRAGTYCGCVEAQSGA